MGMQDKELNPDGHSHQRRHADRSNPGACIRSGQPSRCGGVLRMMLGSMRDMQKKLDEARDTFAKMPEAERSEYVETMAAEFRGWDKDNKQALLGMVKTNFLGMPDTMKTHLPARLKQEK